MSTVSDLFPLLRVLADRPESPARFLILGSAAPELLRHTAQTLAGRVAFHERANLEWERVSPCVTAMAAAVMGCLSIPPP